LFLFLPSSASAAFAAAACSLSAADLFASSAFQLLFSRCSADAAACALALACFFFIAASLCLYSKLLYTTHQLSQVNNQDCITPWYSSGSVISVEVLPGSSYQKNKLLLT
jgi:hypothetical protein